MQVWQGLFRILALYEWEKCNKMGGFYIFTKKVTKHGRKRAFLGGDGKRESWRNEKAGELVHLQIEFGVLCCWEG